MTINFFGSRQNRRVGRVRGNKSIFNLGLSARSGLGCQLEEHARHVKPGALNRAEAGGHLSQFPVKEPGGAWLEPLWPNRRARFGPQCIAFWSSPHPSPGAYKRE